MSHGARRPLAVLLCVACFLLGGAIPVSARDDALDELASVKYTVNPRKSLVRVTISLTLKNQGETPSADRWGPLYLEDSATKIGASWEGGAVRVEPTSQEDGWQSVDLLIDPLRPGESRRIDIRYDVRGGSSPTPGVVRVNPAYAYVCAHGPDADRGSVRFEVPRKGLSVIGGMELPQTVKKGKGRVQRGTGTVEEPGEVQSCVEYVAPSNQLTSDTPLEGPDGRSIQLEAWPGSATWLQAAENTVGSGLQALREAIGAPIPGNGPLVVRQAPNTGAGGYITTHPSTEGIVQASDNLDPGTLSHELAHAWFDAERFPETWLREGLASWAAAKADGRACPEPADTGAGQPDLADWQVAGPGMDLADRIRLTLQGQAACAIVAGTAERMGDEAMLEAIGSLLRGERKYTGTGAVGRAALPTVDWKEWLDAVDERGLVPAGDLDLDATQALLAQYGIATDAVLLAQRSEARAAYHEFKDRVGDLGVPEAVLSALDDWRFDDAQKALATASSVAEVLQQVAELLPEAGLERGFLQQYQDAQNQEKLEQVRTEVEAALGDVVRVVGPLGELREASGDWKLPTVVDTAIVEQRFPDALTAITPALRAMTALNAAQAALPDARVRDSLRKAFEGATSAADLQVQATRAESLLTVVKEAADLKAQASWDLPPAVVDALEAANVEVAAATLGDARAVVDAAAEADEAIGFAGVGRALKGSYEAAADPAALEGLRAEAEALRDQTLETKTAFDFLRQDIGAWQVPPVILSSIEARDFAEARKQLAEAQAWIDYAQLADATVPELKVTPTHQADFESAAAPVDLVDGRTLAYNQSEGARNIKPALDNSREPSDLFAKIGLMGVDLDEQVQATLAAARSGDVEKAIQAALELNSAISNASRGGGLRIAGVVFLGVALFGVLGLWLVLRRDRPPWARQSKPPWAR